MHETDGEIVNCCGGDCGPLSAGESPGRPEESSEIYSRGRGYANLCETRVAAMLDDERQRGEIVAWRLVRRPLTGGPDPAVNLFYVRHLDGSEHCQMVCTAATPEVLRFWRDWRYQGAVPLLVWKARPDQWFVPLGTCIPRTVCIGCGCTREQFCDGGCAWVGPPWCSRCAKYRDAEPIDRPREQWKLSKAWLVDAGAWRKEFDLEALPQEAGRREGREAGR